MKVLGDRPIVVHWLGEVSWLETELVMAVDQDAFFEGFCPNCPGQPLQGDARNWCPQCSTYWSAIASHA